MAKKQNMNIVESHFEKAIVALAALVFVWVIYAHFISPPSIKIGSVKLSASETARRAAELAKDAEQQLGRPAKIIPAQRQSTAEGIFNAVKPFELQVAEAPMHPAFIVGQDQPKDKGPFYVPDILDLQDPKIALTHSLANVPTEQEPEPEQPIQPTTDRFETKDIDFVTVEATFPMKQMYDEFKKSFASPRAGKPLDKFTEPIIAVVQLQRQQLGDDGNWAEPVIVPRLKVDLMAQKKTADQIDKLTPAGFQMLLDQRQDFDIQLDILQPKPYELVEQTWMSPTQQEESESDDRDDRRRPSARPKRLARPGSVGGREGIGRPRDMMRDMRMFGPDGVRTRRRPARRTSIRQNAPDELVTDKLLVWAHDETVASGETYRYSIRLGIFNPIAETNWFVQSQKNLKSQRILWTKWVSPEKIVKIPVTIAFFPTRKSDSVEVFRYQLGRWYKDRFAISPGSAIGQVRKEKLSTKERVSEDSNAETIDVDYRTGAMVLDIIPDRVHWFTRGTKSVKITCDDIIYQTADGTVKRLPIYKNCWPEDLLETYSEVSKQMRAQKKEDKENNPTN